MRLMHESATNIEEQPAPLGRVLLLTGSIGSGHTRAAQAVSEAMLRADAAQWALVVDALAYASAPFRAIYRDAYIKLIEAAPTAIGWLYRSSDTVEGGAMRRAVQRAALARLRRMIASDKPDTIVCTHFLAAELVSGMVERGEWTGTFAVVVTDLDAHAMWAVCPRADRWFVALPETVEILAGKGVPRERMVVTGIPIAGAFSARMPPRAELRERLGLARGGPMLLVSGGGVGASLLEKTLQQVLAMPIDCSVALVCGKNEPLRRRASNIVARRGESRVKCTVLGFTDRMHELMHAADLSIGKPGGLTSSEALACGLPMAIAYPVPGQEERNSDHLLEWGAAIRLNSPESFGWRVAQLLGDPERLSAMRMAARARAKPFAAEAIVEEICALRQSPAAVMPRLARTVHQSA
jgi:processive 1,2-diacylglycerol beta-glucosyltransferase